MASLAPNAAHTPDLSAGEAANGRACDGDHDRLFAAEMQNGAIFLTFWSYAEKC
jgi:hypothetical protein